MPSGIYCIWNTKSNKVYVGSSLNLTRRQHEHFEKLKKGHHFNPYLQRSFKKYGSDNFKWLILEFVENPKQLELMENKWIRHFQSFNPLYGYNSQDVKRIIIRPEIRKKLSAAGKSVFLDPIKRKNYYDAINSIEFKNARTLRNASPIYRNILASATKKSWKNPKIYKKRSDGIKKAWANPKIKEKFLTSLRTDTRRKKMANDAYILWANPNFIHNTPKGKKEQSEKMKTAWKSTEMRKKIITTKNTIEYKQNASNISKEKFKDPEYKAKFLEAHRTNSIRTKISKKATLRWATPEFREKMNPIIQNPEYKKIQAQKSKELWQDPGFREKNMKARQDKMDTPEYKENMRQVMIARWKNPAYKEKMRIAQANRKDSVKKK